MTAILNIGLNVGGVEALSILEVFKAVRKAGGEILSHSLQQSTTERTLVLVLPKKLPASRAHELSVVLEQECIAQLADGIGALHGPKAAEWGPFNPEYFLQPEAWQKTKK